MHDVHALPWRGHLESPFGSIARASLRLRPRLRSARFDLRYSMKDLAKEFGLLADCLNRPPSAPGDKLFSLPGSPFKHFKTMNAISCQLIRAIGSMADVAISQLVGRPTTIFSCIHYGDERMTISFARVSNIEI